MKLFFTIIYIKTNRLSDERIAIGLLSNLNGVPEFHFSDFKLNFALKSINKDLTRSIKRSLNLLKSDVNKYINGETSIPMFDEPYAKKLLGKLIMKKRGILYYGDIHELTKAVDYEVLYKKYIEKQFSVKGMSRSNNQSFRKRFNQHIGHKRFVDFSKKKWLNDSEFPLLGIPVQVDLFRKKAGFTVFKAIDFSLTESKIQQHIATYRMVVESLSMYSEANGLSKGRYYLVYESPKNEAKQALIAKVKQAYSRFELIKMGEMRDKI